MNIAFRSFAFCLGGIALSISGYLAWIAISNQSVPGCGPVSACSDVLKSRWAVWLGLPISLLGVVVYLGVIFTLLLSTRAQSRPNFIIPLRWVALFLGVLVITSSLWFLLLQAVVIKRFCPFCLVVDLAGLFVGGLLVWRQAALGFQPEKLVNQSKYKKTTPTRSSFRIPAPTAALGAFAILIAGQCLYTPARFRVSHTGVPMQKGDSTSDRVAIFNGRFAFARGDAPRFGAVGATNILVLLYDYTCVTCRQMHGPLREVVEASGGSLALIALPVPLDPVCNPAITQALPVHTNACEYARLALAVWRAAPAKFADFDQWLFASDLPPAIAEARRQAEQLVGGEALTTALADPGIDGEMKRNMDLFLLSALQGNASLPQVILGNAVAAGVFRHRQDVELMLRQLLESAAVSNSRLPSD